MILLGLPITIGSTWVATFKNPVIAPEPGTGPFSLGKLESIFVTI